MEPVRLGVAIQTNRQRPSQLSDRSTSPIRGPGHGRGEPNVRVCYCDSNVDGLHHHGRIFLLAANSYLYVLRRRYRILLRDLLHRQQYYIDNLIPDNAPFIERQTLAPIWSSCRSLARRFRPIA
jgi:hypothetical protein